MKRFLVWGDVAFYGALLAIALFIAPRTRFWFAGIALAVIAFPLWVLARLQLGSSFSFKPQARELKTSGLYSKLRHPVYVFGTLAGLGALLALQIWPFLALAVALVPVTLVRARREEKVLESAFGPEYAEYRKRTWF